MDSSKSDELDEIIKYNLAFYEFYNFIDNKEKNKTNKTEENLKYKGYLINLNEFEKFKKNIKYDIIKSYIQKTEDKNKIIIKKEDVKLYFKNNIFKKIEKIKKIKIKSYDFLIKIIMNKKKYILINDKLWRIIGVT